MSCELLLVSLRACAASRCFKEAILAYDHMASRVEDGNGALWSVLLYNVVEAREFHRCKDVFQKLSTHTSPSGHDFVNMMRCFIGKQDMEGLRAILNELREAGHVIDSYTLNRSLAACGNVPSALYVAEELVMSRICTEEMDGVGYNSLMKCNARSGRFARCLELRTEMLAKGLELSEITYGILLDASVNAKELACARTIFNDLCSSSLCLNVVHCTTFIKGLICAGQLDEAAGVLHEMNCSSAVKPDLIAYSTLVKAYAEVGNVPSSLKILEQMLQQNVRPDEIIFNSALGACCSFPMKSNNVMHTFDTLADYGMKPTTTTFSILLKSLALTDAHVLALQVLCDAPAKFGIAPEMRLYTQLIRACVKSRDCRMGVKVFDAMLKASRDSGKKVETADVNRLIRSCGLEGAPNLAFEIQQLAQNAGIVVEAHTDKVLKIALAKQQQRSGRVIQR
jgi:pentatricopeptide repeat protein